MTSIVSPTISVKAFCVRFDHFRFLRPFVVALWSVPPTPLLLCCCLFPCTVIGLDLKNFFNLDGSWTLLLSLPLITLCFTHLYVAEISVHSDDGMVKKWTPAYAGCKRYPIRLHAIKIYFEALFNIYLDTSICHVCERVRWCWLERTLSATNRML